MGDRADVLFVHNNFPAQFGFIAHALKGRGWRCAAIGSPTARSADIPVRQWKLQRGTGKDVFPYATRAEADFLRAQAAAKVAVDLKAKGFDPDVIVGHPGWGETLLLHDVFPRARQVLHGEFYYHALGADVGFDPEFGQPGEDERWRIEAKNATLALAYVGAETIVAPTPFQASQFPAVFQPRLRTIHEGVDTDRIKPRIYLGVIVQVVQHSQSGRHGNRVTRQRAGLIHRTSRCHHTHDVGPAAIGSYRHPTTDNLTHRCQVGGNAEAFLRSAFGKPEAGHHLIENQDNAVLIAERADSF